MKTIFSRIVLFFLFYIGAAEYLASEKFFNSVSATIISSRRDQIPPSLGRGNIVRYQPTVLVAVKYMRGGREMLCLVSYPDIPPQENYSEKFDAEEWIRRHPNGSLIDIRIHRLIPLVHATGDSIVGSTQFVLYFPLALVVLFALLWLFFRAWFVQSRRTRRNSTINSK